MFILLHTTAIMKRDANSFALSLLYYNPAAKMHTENSTVLNVYSCLAESTKLNVIFFKIHLSGLTLTLNIVHCSPSNTDSLCLIMILLPKNENNQTVPPHCCILFNK